MELIQHLIQNENEISVNAIEHLYPGGFIQLEKDWLNFIPLMNLPIIIQ